LSADGRSIVANRGIEYQRIHPKGDLGLKMGHIMGQELIFGFRSLHNSHEPLRELEPDIACVHVRPTVRSTQMNTVTASLPSSLLDIKPSQLDRFEDGICRVGSGREDKEIGIDDPRLIVGFFASGEGLDHYGTRSASLFYKLREPVLHVPHLIMYVLYL